MPASRREASLRICCPPDSRVSARGPMGQRVHCRNFPDPLAIRGRVHGMGDDRIVIFLSDFGKQAVLCWAGPTGRHDSNISRICMRDGRREVPGREVISAGTRSRTFALPDSSGPSVMPHRIAEGGRRPVPMPRIRGPAGRAGGSAIAVLVFATLSGAS